jgi:hypothetical protein
MAGNTPSIGWGSVAPADHTIALKTLGVGAPICEAPPLSGATSSPRVSGLISRMSERFEAKFEHSLPGPTVGEHLPNILPGRLV